MTATLTIENLTVGYDQADVLRGVSLIAPAGKITCLLGANGAGKTTLIRAVLGLTPARAGSVRIDGVELTRRPTHHVIAHGIACIPEGRKVFPKLSVDENLRLGAYLEPDDAVLRTRIAHVYQVFPRLRERARQLAGTMSGGEQAMVSIGRGLMAAPKILLIDEPSLGLSPLYVRENFSVIQRINESGVTVLLVEQNVHQTLNIAHFGYLLTQGRVTAHGSAEDLRDNADVQAAYFG